MDNQQASCHCPAVCYNETSAQDSVSPLVKTDISFISLASSEVFAGWPNSLGSPLPSSSTPFRCRNWGAVSDEFCKFSKPTIRHSHSLHTVISQLCRGEKRARVLTSLSNFLTNYFTFHVNKRVQHHGGIHGASQSHFILGLRLFSLSTNLPIIFLINCLFYKTSEQWKNIHLSVPVQGDFIKCLVLPINSPKPKDM